MHNQAHIGIIGAGIVGICTALQLQQAGFRVTLIDKRGIAQGCSKGNAGHFATEQVFPLADKSLLPQLPKMLLDPLGPFRIDWRYLLKALPWFVRFLLNMRKGTFNQNRDAIKALNQHAIGCYEPLLRQTNSEAMVKLKGSLLTFEHDDMASIQKQAASFSEQGVRVEVLDRQATLTLEPSLSDKVKASLFFPDVGHTVDPEQLCLAFASTVYAQGGTMIKDSVTNITPKGNHYWVECQQSSYRFDRLVIATGAWSKSILAPLGYQAPLDTERGYHLMLPHKDVLTRPVASAERRFIMTPMADGLRLAGTVEFAGLAAPQNDKRAEILLPHANQLIDNFNVALNDNFPRWMGFRPSLPDSLPVVGEAPHHKHLYFAFGHQHLGLTWGAITGQLIAEIATEQQPTIDVKPYCISRFN